MTRKLTAKAAKSVVLEAYNAMKGKRRTSLPRPPTRKQKPRTKPAPPRAKGEVERLAVRRRAAMPYRLAGASYRTIATKLTEDRANAYADANGISVERAMKQLPHVSKRTAWDDVTAELEELRRETEVNRADSMAGEVELWAGRLPPVPSAVGQPEQGIRQIGAILHARRGATGGRWGAVSLSQKSRDLVESQHRLVRQVSATRFCVLIVRLTRVGSSTSGIASVISTPRWSPDTPPPRLR